MQTHGMTSQPDSRMLGAGGRVKTMDVREDQIV